MAASHTSLNGIEAVHAQRLAIALEKRMVRPALAVSFAIVFTPIARPELSDTELMQVAQQPLIDLREAMSKPT